MGRRMDRRMDRRMGRQMGIRPAERAAYGGEFSSSGTGSILIPVWRCCYWVTRSMIRQVRYRSVQQRTAILGFPSGRRFWASLMDSGILMEKTCSALTLVVDLLVHPQKALIDARGNSRQYCYYICRLWAGECRRQCGRRSRCIA